MQTIVFEGQDRIVLQEKPVPALSDGDVLIKVDLCGICASDIAAINGEVTDYSPPVVLGHEIAGVIVESRHPEVQVDQKVTVNPLFSCGACDYCRVDLDKYCSQIEGIGHDLDGGYADFLKFPKYGVDTGNLITVPDSVSPENLMFLEPLGCCINAMRETILSESVAILGAGQIGLMFAQLATLHGLEVFLLEPDVHRRDFANSLGLDRVFDITDNEIKELIGITSGGVDTVISATTNNQKAIDLAFQIVRHGGCINFFGLSAHDQNLTINLEKLHFFGHKLMASWAFSRWSLGQAQQMIVNQEIQLEPMLTTRFPISSGIEAISHVRHGRGLKTALVGGFAAEN